MVYSLYIIGHSLFMIRNGGVELKSHITKCSSVGTC